MIRHLAMSGCAVVAMSAIAAGCLETSPQDEHGNAAAERTARQVGSPLTRTFGSWGPRAIVFPPDDVGNIPGYRHDLARSRFPLTGKVQTLQIDPNVQRIDGANGSVVQFGNGFFMARPYGGSALTAVGPLTGVMTEHHARVRAYFKDAGLPDDQVGDVSVTTDIEEVADSATMKVLQRKFVGYTSILYRRVRGVRVAGSRAWAQFNKNDEVVAEEVWWPNLPASAVSDALAASNMLADPKGLLAFQASLPDELRVEDGIVTIHHSEPRDHGWYTIVTIDYAKGKNIYSFDISGTPVFFAAQGPNPNAMTK